MKAQSSFYSSTLKKKNKTKDLFSSVLPQSLSLIESIDKMVHIVNTKCTVHVDFIHCGFEQERLKEQDRIAVYLIVKTQLRNIIQNGRATTAAVHLAKNYEQLAIVIEDNELAADGDKTSRSLTTIENLVKHHNGKYAISHDPDAGTVLEILISVNEE